MPTVNVNLSVQQLVTLDTEAKKTGKSRSVLVRERLDHKCPERKPCEEVHARMDKKKGMLLEFPDSRGKWLTPEQLEKL